MSVTIDCYPNETKSFDALPQDSPLQHLDYGGMLTMISNHVQQERAQNRIKRREFLIKKINNVNLDVTINKIKEEAKCLKSYQRSNKTPYTKENYLMFFQFHDIPLQFLEDMYDKQSKGMPVVKKNSLIEIKDDYTHAAYGVVVKERQKGKSSVEYIIVDKNLLPITIRHNLLHDSRPYIMNVWKCKVIGEFTEENWEVFNHAIHKNNRDIKCREEFWNNHPVLSTLDKPWRYYHNEFDIMNGEIPLSDTYSCLDQRYFVHSNVWKIFRECINEKLRLERENQ